MSVPSGSTFGLTELSARSGVPVPTIHHYRKLGLLPGIGRFAGNRFAYDERHVAALGAIRALRAHHVPLVTVGRVLPGLLESPGELFSGERWQELIADGPGRDGQLALASLLDSARDLFAAEGYDAVSVGQICDTAGVAKGTFYRYFDSKDAVFMAAARSTVEAVGRQLDRGKGALSETEALCELERFLAPFVPLLLEAATRELREEPSPGVVASVAQGLAARLVPRLGSQGSRTVSSAARVVERVILTLVRPALGLRSF
ncbi:MAG: TetR family transcriptional regulator [Acidimicrobiales bacterium]